MKSKKEIAKERINILFEQIQQTPKFANRYIQLALRIAMKARIPIPTKYKRKFCKHCKKYFKKDKYKIRLKKGKKHYWCLYCNKLTRVPYK